MTQPSPGGMQRPLSDPNGLGPPMAPRSLGSRIRRRFLAGLLLVLPFFVTFWILHWLYSTINVYAIQPAARLVMRVSEGRVVELPPWFVDYLAPALGALGVVLLLYFLGFLAHSRLVRLLDWLLLRVPIVTSIYKGVSKVFEAVSGQGEMAQARRVVLVSFPHPGMRVPGFVTSSCVDVQTGKVILNVYVPTSPMPTSGYVLMIPEEDVTDLDWNMEETVQAVVSFGLTTPDHIRYFRPMECEKAGEGAGP